MQHGGLAAIEVDGHWDSCLNWFRKTRRQGRVWSAAIVVGNEFTEDALQMPLVQRNQIVQALAPNTANHPLAMSIPFRMLGRSVDLRNGLRGELLSRLSQFEAFK